MGVCYISRRGTKASDSVEQLGIYPIGNNGRPIGNVTVLDNVVNLNQYIFRNDSNVISVSLPEGLQVLDEYVFQNCTGLQLIDIPDRVNTIPQYCFDGCTNIYKVVLPDDINTIRTYAFQNCSSLMELVIPESLSFLIIGSYAFKNCQYLNNATVSKLATLNNNSNNINAYAFSNLKGITDVTTYYTNANYFYECTNLRKCTILHPLPSTGGFGSTVFDGCINLLEVTLPNDATLIDSNMFSGRTSLTTVNIPTSVQTIGNDAFYNTGITSVSLPSTLTTISDYAFQNCKQLQDVTIDENAVYSLARSAFEDCSKLTDTSAHNLMEHYSSIGSYVFRNCTSLKNISVTRFWSYMFQGCTGLLTAESYLAANTGDFVFYGCSSLQSVTIANGTTIIGSSIFRDCVALKTVYLPSSITTATSSCLTSTSSSYYAFNGCTALQDIQVGEGWSLSIRLNVSNNITVSSMVAMFDNLADLTGSAAQTITLGSTNLAKLTDEQKAVATNKNWTLA